MPVLKEGAKAPSFSLPDADGRKVSLADFKGKTVVLYFYPKDLTPGCTQEACDFQSALPKLKKSKAVVLGVSRDSSASHAKFRDKHDLDFPLLADEEGAVCKAYGVWQKKSLYGREFMGIVRTTFVIGPDGKVRKIFPKVKVKGHVEAVLAAVNE
ncbi:MAG: thioredoxin-dependent thiol peroxidase [Bacteriovoracia bacterium]